MRAFGWGTAIAAGLVAALCMMGPSHPRRVVAVVASGAVTAAVVVLVAALVGGVVLVAVAVRHRSGPPIVRVVPEPVEVWHCTLTAITARGTVTLKRGPVQFPALTAAVVEDEVLRRFVDRYGVPDGARGLDCRAVPAQRVRAGE
jgi:hypothetical protein